MIDAPYTAERTVPLRALVVDDTVTNRQILQVFLKKLGFLVELAANGVQAIEVFERTRPDLVLMDVMMPVMDGYEATRRIKTLSGERWVPVIFLSALDKEENLVAGLNAGGDDYLPKPINFVVLDAKLRSVRRALLLQKALEENRRRTQAITDNMLDGIVTIDEQGVVQSVNPAVLRMFGYTGEELIGGNVNRLMAEPQRSEHDGYLRRYIETGEAHIIGKGGRESVGQRRDGSIFPLELGVTELWVDDKRYFVGIIRDITERAEAQRRLRDALELNQGIIAAAPYGIAAFRPSGECLFANERLGEIIGESRDEFVMQNFRQIASWRSFGITAAAEATLADGGTRCLEVRIRTSAGKLRWLSIVFTTFHRNGQPHLLMMVGDISDRKQAEEQLKSYMRELQQYHDEREAENALAQDIVRRQMERPGLSDAAVHHWLRPAAGFSGDIVAAARAPDGRFYALLADATGHGLAAALSALPVLTVFYGLTERSPPLANIVDELNRQLLATMPAGRFVAAALLSLDARASTAELWLGGMPDVLLLDAEGRVKRRFASPYLPLGIQPMSEEDLQLELASVQLGEQFVLCSDGLIEAAGLGGEAFGHDHLIGCFVGVPAGERLERMRQFFDAFTGGGVPHDDISLLLVDCLTVSDSS